MTRPTLEEIREREASGVFRRERRWFSLGLAILTFAYLLGVWLYTGFDRDSSTSGITLVIAGAAGMWLAAALTYSMTQKDLPPDIPARLRDVVSHVIIVPIIAFPVASFILGFLMTGFSPDSIGAGLIIFMGHALVVFIAPEATLLFIVPCLVITCGWSAAYLYVIRPKYLSATGRSSTPD